MTTKQTPPGWADATGKSDRGGGDSQSGPLKSPEPPEGLSGGGERLWNGITRAHELDVSQLVQLEEACRAKDRCDRLNDALRAGHDSKLQADANNTATMLKQLLAALRLPDPKTGKRPQYRGPRGVYAPSGAKVSSLERARARRSQ